MSNLKRPTSEKRQQTINAPDLRAEGRHSDHLECWQADAGRRTLDLEPERSDVGLAVTDLRKSFVSPSGERIEVLRGVSFSASPGEAVAIVGPSGAGKSTLLHLLGGIEASDHGNVALGALAIDRAARSQLARYRNQQVGFVFQFHHLLPDLTALENVALPLLVGGKSRREASIKATTALERVGLGGRTSHRVTDLSGGEQQRVAICRALINQPLLVLADEPTGNLDASGGRLIADDIVSYADSRPAIVIIATHNRELAQLCNRILTLQDGKISHFENC